MVKRLREAWELWRGMPGLLHRVHELALELVAELPTLRQAGKAIAYELQQRGSEIESVRLDLERERTLRATEAYPVTVSIMARTYIPGTEKTYSEPVWDGSTDRPLRQRTERAQFGYMIGAKTAFVCPGGVHVFEFGAQELIGAGAAVWVSGPARVEEVVVGHDICQLWQGFGVAAVIGRAVHVGERITCKVVGVRAISGESARRGGLVSDG